MNFRVPAARSRMHLCLRRLCLFAAAQRLKGFALGLVDAAPGVVAIRSSTGRGNRVGQLRAQVRVAKTGGNAKNVGGCPMCADRS